ncbi:caM kinase-like vesicle-associated protein [Erpetoichthys calabaricus]|uniref:caM kinase-like vesicle-associated protein n=1 Tax=Erpetoichthys calabaricus TaxID=27687 RepID=UPI00223452F2|nr:caM kinase-like vesicle-associated protein [Erpetoichthys calabaricus]
MPFGCIAIRDGRSYNSLSEITEKYEIGQVLRTKEFCELCLAKERQTEKVFVCKKFLKRDGRKVRKAAKNEIMILKMVSHPNILQLIDTFETKKEYYIIQELASGGDVFDWILDQGNYTERDASNVIRQVLEAVAYLHSLHIVHRNLKLENLMYYNHNNHNKVVLRDFYLSCFENGSITEPCGTPEYLAPEVVARHRYGRPVDCWAVGVIMYILLSGNPPFYDETEEENTDLHNRIIFCKIVSGEFEFDSPYWDDISPAAKELVCRLMEVDPMLRITAQDALWHEWIAGNGALEKNLKAGVCAQFEKNFAKAKWRPLGIVTIVYTVLVCMTYPVEFQGTQKAAQLKKRADTSSSQQTSPRKSTAVLDQANEKTLVSADQNGKNKAIIKESNEKKTTIYQDKKAVPLKKSTENIIPALPDEHEHKKVILLDSVTEVKPQLSPLSSHSGRKLPGVSEQSKRRMAAVLDQDLERKSDRQRPSFQEQRKRQDLPGYDERDNIESIADQGEWRMDRVIEQIEKQMAAVLEKIEGEIPCLLEQIGEKGDPTVLEYKETHIVAALDQSRSVLEQNEGSYNQKGAARFSKPSLPVLRILSKDVQSEETCIEVEDDTDTEKVKESMSLDKI